MRTKASIFLSVAAVLLLWSCSADTRTTPKGYSFTVIKAGDGKTVQPGEVIVLDMTISDENDSIWYDNRTAEYPEMIRIAEPTKIEMERGLTEIFRMLSKGDSIEFTQRAKDVFLSMWKMDTPIGVDPLSDFTYRIKCREVFDQLQAAQFHHQLDSIHAIRERKRAQREEDERRATEEASAGYNKVQLAKDTVIIDNYLKGKNVKAKTLPSGLRYIVKKTGEGPLAVNGDFVNMKYAGQLLDGKEFDSGEYTFQVGSGDVIKAWDLAAMNMQKGSAITLFVPSTLAYGQGGRAPVIGPDAILVFEMELISIIKQ